MPKKLGTVDIFYMPIKPQAASRVTNHSKKG